MEQLYPIIDRDRNQTLDELRLVHCKTTPELLGNMIDYMAQVGTYISRIGLVHA